MTPEMMQPAVEPTDLPANTLSMIVGGGCFWCVDSAFRHIKGVEHVMSGYANGHI